MDRTEHNYANDIIGRACNTAELGDRDGVSGFFCALDTHMNGGGVGPALTMHLAERCIAATAACTIGARDCRLRGDMTGARQWRQLGRRFVLVCYDALGSGRER